MVEKNIRFTILSHSALIIAAFFVLFPLWVLIVGSSHSAEELSSAPPIWFSGSFFSNLSTVLFEKNLLPSLLRSFTLASFVTIGKCIVASLTAFVVVFFRFRFTQFFFWMVFITLMLPLEVRIVPTYVVTTNVLEPFQFLLDIMGISWLFHAISGHQIQMELNLINTYWGMALPLIATATGTFLMRQFFRTIPAELVEAAKMDKASAWRFFVDILIPLSKTTLASLATIMFIANFNSYMWPLMVATDKSMTVAVTELANLIPSETNAEAQWNEALSAALLVMIPPITVVIILQKWFIKGLINKEK